MDLAPEPRFALAVLCGRVWKSVESRYFSVVSRSCYSRPIRSAKTFVVPADDSSQKFHPGHVPVTRFFFFLKIEKLAITVGIRA